MEESSISLELKILYGKGITGFNFFQKLLIYAAVSLSSDDPEKKLNQAQKQRTAADKEGDGSPEWNHEIRFDLTGIPHLSDDVFLRFDLYHEGVMFGDKHIGQVRVPLRDFTDEAGGVVRFVSYQVKGPDGKPNGVLTFSYKLNGVGHGGSISSGVTGYAIVDQNHHQESAESEDPNTGIVTYPTLEDFDNSAPPPAVNYYPTLDSYYPPPPPPAPQAIYPMPPPPQPQPPAWPPGPAMHHHHHHHHHHLWGHDPSMGGGGRWNSMEEREGWRREDPYAPPWTGR